MYTIHKIFLKLGFYGDTFSGGFGDFYTARKRSLLNKDIGIAVPRDIKLYYAAERPKVIV